jgi:6,7-dimethyl-8-ribityllumazine synthase
MRIAIVISRFHEVITDRLLNGALSCLKQHGVPRTHVAEFHCPGAFEIPQVAAAVASSGRYDAVVCLGAVIRGETPHFEYVAGEAARGIQTVALTSGLPVLFGILTTENKKQALDRSGGKHGNKGWDAAVAALEMVALLKSIKRLRGR